ncbi:uncharacterized protein TNCV_3259171 [Trichonephila clavipes]|nr:uncharacterized protein TNCV_3259171 [Trichonephila clavipes]
MAVMGRIILYTGLKKLSCRTPELEAKTRHRASLVSAHVTTLEEDLKQQPLCQDSPKDVLSDSGLEIELAIPFVPNRDPPDTPQQSELGEVVHYQNEVVTNSSSTWADIWIKGLIPISKTSYGSSMEHMQISRRPESLSIVNLDPSVNSTEAHCCCIQETCSLAQHKRFLRCRPLRGTHTTGLLAYRLAL